MRPGVPYTVPLSAGEQYQLRSDSGTEDLSGTLLTSNNPVAVFAGHECANIPNNSASACDHVVEQVAPDATWGRSFLSVPLKGRINGDTFKFMATEDDTIVQVNGATVATLDAGEQHQQLVVGNAQIEADKAIFVAQFANGTTFDNRLGDPFMMMIPPFEQFQTGYTVSTPAEGFAQNHVNLVVPDSAVGNVAIDGVPVPAAAYTPIGSSGYQGAQRDISLGSHNITGDGQPFGAFVYGWNSADSYGYPGGLLLAEVARVTSVDLTPETATNPVGTEHCVTALVTDQDGNPVVGVRVDFVVTGANPTSGSVNTGADGKARFCYTGTNEGDDSITGSVGALSDEVDKTWVDEGGAIEGSMAGEGRLTQSASNRLDYAYVLDCTRANNTPVKFKGKRNSSAFVVTSLTSVECVDQAGIEPANPAAGFDTMLVEGLGKVGSTNVSVEAEFVDGGTGGANDSAFIEIRRTSDGAVLFSDTESPIGPYGGGTRPGRNTASPPAP